MSRRQNAGGDTAADFSADVVLEFIEAAVHATLHRRGVYPAEAFAVVRLYDVPLHRARHPELCDYITSVKNAMRPMVLTGAASRLDLLICGETEEEVLERHVFTFGLLGAAAAAAAQLKQAQRQLPPPAEVNAALEEVLKRQLAEMLVRHSQTDRCLHPLPQECTFRLVVHTTDRGEDPDIFWVNDGIVAGGGAMAANRRAATAAPPSSLDVHALQQSSKMEPLFHLELFAESMQLAETR